LDFPLAAKIVIISESNVRGAREPFRARGERGGVVAMQERFDKLGPPPQSTRPSSIAPGMPSSARMPSVPPSATQLAPAVTMEVSSLAAAADALASCEEHAFLCSWLPTLAAPLPPPLAVRLAMSLRMMGRLQEARALLEGLPRTPAGWNARDRARLDHE